MNTLVRETRIATLRPGLIATLANFVAVARQRRQLAQLDDTRLADLGLSRDQARTEANRPAWDVPAHWRA